MFSKFNLLLPKSFIFSSFFKGLPLKKKRIYDPIFDFPNFDNNSSERSDIFFIFDKLIFKVVSFEVGFLNINVISSLFSEIFVLDSFNSENSSTNRESS